MPNGSDDAARDRKDDHDGHQVAPRVSPPPVGYCCTHAESLVVIGALAKLTHYPEAFSADARCWPFVTVAWPASTQLDRRIARRTAGALRTP